MILTVFFSKEKNRRIQQQFRSVQSSKQVHHDTVIFIVLSSLTGYTSTIASAARVTKAGRAGHFIEKQTIFKSVFLHFMSYRVRVAPRQLEYQAEKHHIILNVNLPKKKLDLTFSHHKMLK